MSKSFKAYQSAIAEQFIKKFDVLCASNTGASTWTAATIQREGAILVKKISQKYHNQYALYRTIFPITTEIHDTYDGMFRTITW